MNLVIRPEEPADWRRIHALSVEAFATRPYGDGTEGALVDALRRDGDLALSLVAVIETTIVGQVSFSPARVGGRPNWFGLGPVSVEPDRQRQGIGSALIRQGIGVLREQGAAGIVLAGDPRYYGRFGFENRCGLEYLEVDPENLHRLVLAGPAATGPIEFATALHGA